MKKKRKEAKRHFRGLRDQRFLKYSDRDFSYLEGRKVLFTNTFGEEFPDMTVAGIEYEIGITLALADGTPCYCLTPGKGKGGGYNYYKIFRFILSGIKKGSVVPYDKNHCNTPATKEQLILACPFRK